eukprot:superscaffoldBa00006262_g21323
MKVRKSSTQDEVKKRKKAVLFCLSEDRKKIIVEEGKQILVGDIGESVDDPYACFVKLLPPNDCRYGLYDATYETKESKKEDLVFIFWAPESAPLKSKMIYASSKDAIKKKFTGIKHEWQVNGLDDIQDRSTLAEKLGGNVVVSLEGKPLQSVPAVRLLRGSAVLSIKTSGIKYKSAKQTEAADMLISSGESDPPAAISGPHMLLRLVIAVHKRQNWTERREAD